MTHDFIDSIQLHPSFGAKLAILNIIIAEIISPVFIAMEIQMPLIVMQVLQCIAWIIGSVVGLLSIYSWYMKYVSGGFDKKNKDKYHDSN